MKEFIKKYDILTKAFALLAAVVLWFYVLDYDNPEKEIEYPVVVNLLGQEELLNAYNLSVVSGTDTTVRVSISGNNDQMSKLSSENIVVSADLSSITTPGEFTIPYEVVPPMSTVSVVGKTPNYIDVVIDKMITQSIPVEIVVEGNPANGYYYMEPVLSETRVKIQGPQTEVEQITHAELVINANGLGVDFSENLEYNLINSSGEVVISPNITKEQTTINAYIDVKKVEEIPLTVTLVDGENVDETMVNEINIFPETIKVMGENTDFEGVSSINVGQIQLAEELDNEVVIKSIILPDGLSFVEEDQSSAEILLDLDLVKTQIITVDDVEFEDLADDPVEFISGQNVLSVTLSARESVLETFDFTEEDLVTAKATFNSEALQEGFNTLVVQIIAPEELTPVGVYTIEVEVREP